MQVEKAKPGPKTRRLHDERGLYLVVRAAGSRSWVQRITIDGDRTDIGLGGYPDVLLAQARKKSAEIRAAVAEGRDPRAERRQPDMPTFRDAAEQYISDNAVRWKNPKESVNWRGCLNTYAYPKFGNTRIDRDHPRGRSQRAQTSLEVQTINCPQAEATHQTDLRGRYGVRLH